MSKLERAARALLAHWDTPAWKYLKPTGDLMADLRDALAEQAEQEPVFSSKCPKCNHKVIGTHIGEVWWCPKCQHEWPFEKAEQKPFDMDDHPPHRLCECRKCMEYFTPLPDCDAFAAPVRTKDYNPEVTFNDDGTFSLTLPDDDELRIIPPQQEPTAEVSEEGYAWGKDGILLAGTKLYAAPVRTKDLTDDEIYEAVENIIFDENFDINIARAVIAKFKEKNK